MYVRISSSSFAMFVNRKFVMISSLWFCNTASTLCNMKKLSTKKTSVVFQNRSYRSVLPMEYARILGIEGEGTFQIKQTLVLIGTKHYILTEKA